MIESPVPPARRRFFLTVLLGGVGAVMAGVAAWPVWEYLAPRKGPKAGEKVTLARSQVSPGSAHFFTFHGHPAVLVQGEPGKFTALTAVCTHLGCIVKWVPEKNEFLCPCHAGRFSPDGSVLGGPPPKPLESYPVSVQGDNIHIG